MKQIVNIKKVSVDSELRVTAVLEFIASNAAAKGNVFRFIRLQGNVVEVSLTPSHQDLSTTA